MFEYLSYNNFYLIPNWLESNTEDYPSSLRRFMYSRMTYYVLNNSGGRFLMGLIASILMYLFVKLSYYRYLIKIFEIFLDKLEFSYFIKFYELFLLDLLVSSLHNIYYNSMGSNWKGTNTIFSFIFLFIIAFVQIGSLVLVFFKQHLGTEKEVETMLSTLHDG